MRTYIDVVGSLNLKNVRKVRDFFTTYLVYIHDPTENLNS